MRYTISITPEVRTFGGATLYKAELFVAAHDAEWREEIGVYAEECIMIEARKRVEEIRKMLDLK